MFERQSHKSAGTNPAGQSILQKAFGEGGISPLKLLLAALAPTIIMGAAFMLLP